MRISTLLFLTLFCLPSLAKIARDKSYATLQTTYSTYKDIQLNAGSTNTIASSLDLEAALKVFSTFYILGVTSQTSDQSRNAYGLGLRVDLPGIFFVGGKDRLLKSKRYPVNTSGYFHSLITSSKVTDSTAIDRSVATRYGFTSEIFLFNQFTYLALDLSLYNLEGNSFATYAIGLGLEF